MAPAAAPAAATSPLRRIHSRAQALLPVPRRELAPLPPASPLNPRTISASVLFSWSMRGWRCVQGRGAHPNTWTTLAILARCHSDMLPIKIAARAEPKRQEGHRPRWLLPVTTPTAVWHLSVQGLFPRAKELLRLGGSVFLGFLPFMLAFSLLFTGIFAASVVHHHLVLVCVGTRSTVWVQNDR